MKLVYSVEDLLGIWSSFRVCMYTVYNLVMSNKKGYSGAILSVDSRHSCEGQSGPLVNTITVHQVGRAWPIPNVQVCSSRGV